MFYISFRLALFINKNKYKLIQLIVWCIIWSILFLWIESVHAQVTFKQAQNVLIKLQNVTGQHVVLKYSKDSYANAYTGRYCIIITQGMLNNCRNESDLIMALGHELGHWMYKDSYSYTNYKVCRYEELRADQVGYNLCKKLGYKKCKSYMTMMQKKYPHDTNEIYPTWYKRYKHLRD